MDGLHCCKFVEDATRAGYLFFAYLKGAAIVYQPVASCSY